MFWVLNIFSKVHLPLKYWKVLQNLSNYVCQYCVRKLQFGHWKCIVQMCSQAELYHAFFSTLLKKFQFYYFCFQFVIGITYSESFFFFFPGKTFHRLQTANMFCWQPKSPQNVVSWKWQMQAGLGEYHPCLKSSQDLDAQVGNMLNLMGHFLTSH